MTLLSLAVLAESLVNIIADLLVTTLVERTVFTRFKERDIRNDIAKAIREALDDTLQTYPGFDVALGDAEFFKDPGVATELQKLVSPTEAPNVEILIHKWKDYFGTPLQGDLALALSKFLQNAEKNLRHIREISIVLHQKETTASFGLLSDRVSLVQASIDRVEHRLLSESPTPSSTESDLQASAQIEMCQGLIEAGQPRAAKQQLIRLQDKLQYESLSIQLKFRLLTNLAKCAFELGDSEEGKRYFVRAHEIDPENPRGQANLALSYLIEGKIQEAFDLASKVLAQLPTGTGARAVRVQAQARLMNYQNLEKIVEPEHLDDAKYVGALGLVFAGAGQYDQAISYLRRAVAFSENDFESRLLLAQVLTTRANERGDGDLFPLPQSTIVHKEAIDEALIVVDEALEIARAGDNTIKVHDALAARADLNLLLNEMSRAKADCDVVLSENPDHILALRDRAIISMHEKSYGEAVRYFERLPRSTQLSHSAAFVGARALIETNRAKEALELLKELSPAGTIKDDPWVALSADALVRLGQIQEATSLRNALLVQRSHDPNALELAAYIDSLLGNVEGELQNLIAASKVALGQHRNNNILRLALRYYEYRQFDGAVGWFEQVGEELLANSAYGQAYVISLYSTRQYGKAYATARKIRANGVVNQTLVEIEAWIAEYLGDLKEAAALSEILMAQQPSVGKYVVSRARLEYRMGHKAEAEAVLKLIDHSKLREPESLMQVAEMFAFLEQPYKALSLAYRSRRSGYGDPDIHLGYVSLFLRCDERVDNLDPIQVRANTAVLLQTNGTTQWIRILDEIEPDNSRGEFSLESEQAQRLLGHRIGDVVPFREGPLETLRFTIIQIQSIYVRAFQETLEEFSTLFPSHPGLHKMQVSDKDIVRFFTVVAGQSEFAGRLYELYHEGAITLEQLAIFMGRPQIDIQQGLAGLDGHRILVSTGTEQDQAIDRKRVEVTQDITLGLSSLVTLGLLDMLGATAERFNSVFVPQQVVDELDRSLLEREQWAKKKGGTIGYANGRFFWEEVPPDQVQKSIEGLRRLSDSVRHKFKVLGISPQFAGLLGHEDNEPIERGPVPLCL